jgi:hypothetical protein
MLAIDLFCGLGGWAEGFLAEGYDVVGFDIERHDYGTGGYPGQLVLQDVTTLHGKQFKDARVIVASPPCQAYSYRAMPWKRAKALPPPDNTLFETCFRIQREASEAAGRHIPLIVENVRGAQKWVGRSAWNFGSFHLWGDIPALMPIPSRRGTKVPGLDWSKFGQPGYKDGPGKCFRDSAIKNIGGSWFNIAHNTTSGVGQNPDGRKCGGSWFGSGNDCSLMRQHSSKSPKRKAASAMIAKIPFPLAQHIARCFVGQSTHRDSNGTNLSA